MNTPTPRIEFRKTIDNSTGVSELLADSNTAYISWLERELTAAREELKDSREHHGQTIKALEDLAYACDCIDSEDFMPADMPLAYENAVAVLKRTSNPYKAITEQRDRLAEALMQCREDSVELLGERDWWQNEIRLDYQKRYQETRDNVTRADEALQRSPKMSDTPKLTEAADSGSRLTPCSPSELGKRIAREVFECGDEPSSKCTRIQFLGGSFVKQNERAQGGFNEQGLARQITAILAKIHQENETNPAAGSNLKEYGKSK